MGVAAREERGGVANYDGLLSDKKMPPLWMTRERRASLPQQTERHQAPNSRGAMHRIRRRVSALLMASAAISTGCPTGPVRPLNVVSSAVDENVYSRNPFWQDQVTKGAGSIADAITCGPTGGAQDDPQNWTTGPHPCTSYPVTTNRGAVCGPHVNWFPVAYEGTITWGDHSGDDDDYNVIMHRDDKALYTQNRNDGLLCEFDSDETIDHFETGWWRAFHAAVDDSDAAARALIDHRKAVVVGLLGLDCAGHDAGNNTCGAELHPVYMLAVNVDGSDPHHDRWVFFARNRGDEGYCSDDEENLPVYSNTNDAVYEHRLLLANTGAADATVINQEVRIYGDGDSKDADGSFEPPTFLKGKGLQLTFRLPNPETVDDDDDWVIEGEVVVDWQ